MTTRFNAMRGLTVVSATLVGAVALPACGSASPPATRYHYAGLDCLTSDSARGVACVRADNKGYAVRAVAENVAVQNPAGRVVYEKLNSQAGGPARRFPFAGKTLIDFDAIRCTAKLPARIACARSDGTGFGIVITKTYVAVIRIVDGKRIFYRANP